MCGERWRSRPGEGLQRGRAASQHLAVTAASHRGGTPNNLPDREPRASDPRGDEYPGTLVHPFLPYTHSRYGSYLTSSTYLILYLFMPAPYWTSTPALHFRWVSRYRGRQEQQRVTPKVSLRAGTPHHNQQLSDCHSVSQHLIPCQHRRRSTHAGRDKTHSRWKRNQAILQALT